MADLGCAQNPDLTLRDASEINFYYDAEDEQPISGPSSKPMHPLVAGIAPLQKVAGVRHSNRKPKLSARAKAARDLDSDTDASASSTKRKATSPGRKTVTKAARLAGSASAATAAEAASGTDSDGSGSGDNYEEQKQSDAVPTSGDDALKTTDTEDEDATIQARGAFEKFKAMGDADHAKAIQTKSRSDKTADIRLMFIKKKDYPHPDTGVPTKGHICIICDADGEIGIQVFFTGSVTTLRQHIARQRGHYPIYKAKCDAAGIQPHASAIPKALISNETQGTLDAVLVAKPRIPAFSSGGVRDFLTELIVTNDQALLLVEQPAFRRLLQYFRPSTQDGDIPSRQSIPFHKLKQLI
ncbi:hypothetical protein HMN09_00161800 [Mycena chlorophos]|uniref:Uncharacterized protein n=1 Tax=Mycena chlorophos TaxID=658473 RepID=A0A8H6TKY1_MYCCL|nr:hypothetical protein HMN09_00161800 [Mycena chlorophos]